MVQRRGGQGIPAGAGELARAASRLDSVNVERPALTLAARARAAWAAAGGAQSGARDGETGTRSTRRAGEHEMANEIVGFGGLAWRTVVSAGVTTAECR